MLYNSDHGHDYVANAAIRCETQQPWSTIRLRLVASSCLGIQRGCSHVWYLDDPCGFSGASEGLKTTKGSSTDDQGIVHIALGCQWSTISSAQNRGKWHDITRDVKFVYNSKSNFVCLNPVLNRISTPPPPKKKKKNFFFFLKSGNFLKRPQTNF